jgi:hypothetical protein
MHYLEKKGAPLALSEFCKVNKEKTPLNQWHSSPLNLQHLGCGGQYHNPEAEGATQQGCFYIWLERLLQGEIKTL